MILASYRKAMFWTDLNKAPADVKGLFMPFDKRNIGAGEYIVRAEHVDKDGFVAFLLPWDPKAGLKYCKLTPPSLVKHIPGPPGKSMWIAVPPSTEYARPQDRTMWNPVPGLAYGEASARLASRNGAPLSWT